MALHLMPDDEQDGRHTFTDGCPCKPSKSEGHATVGAGRNRTPYRGVIYRHQHLEAPAPVELHDRIAVPDDEADYVTEACGHVVVEVNGEWQHHDIPDDGAPHAPTSECGCGPQRSTSDLGHIVYEHDDQGDDVNALYREVFGE